MSKRKKRMYVFGSIFSMVALVCLLVLLPQHLAVQALGEQTHQTLLENQKIQQIILNSQHAGQRLQEIEELLEGYQRMIPKVEELSAVLDNIASGAATDQLQVISLQAIDDEKKEEGDKALFQYGDRVVKEVMIVMRAQGYFQSVGRYLTRLENAPYKIIVKETNIKNRNLGRADIHEEPKLDVDLKFSILMSFKAGGK